VEAVVLVGGFGTRLRPLTRSTPKQMLPVGHQPMIEHVLAHLRSHGVERAALALGYRPDSFVDAYPDGRCAGVELHYAIEPEPRDTAGAIRFAALDASIEERFLVVNGDVLTDLDVGALVTLHEARGAEGTIALHRVADPSAFGVVPTEPDGRVRAFIEKPPRRQAPTDLINAGTYVLERSVLDRIAPDVPVNVERVTFPAMVSDGSLYALDGDTYWIDAGTPATYLQANLDLISGRRITTEPAVHDSARVEGLVVEAVIGAQASVGHGALVERSVLLPGATIAQGATVRDSIVGARATVGAGATVEAGTVLGDDAAVPAGSALSGVRWPEED
jgi:mannose-1-phosphate guanylyltransferase